ncbi:MAG TPA: hydroxymethylbilane synthase [Candidatus Paceibacterota bacterium]|nr:hydroxymethylbilane synthase [Verrucomicrobiota bacterium]HRZ45406.1 hydroxymethylbilane synthase [Candidatus Paceibacterota bacterium]
MSVRKKPFVVATRGSVLALAQAHLVVAACQRAHPRMRFEIRVFKTRGDALALASLAGQGGDSQNPGPSEAPGRDEASAPAAGSPTEPRGEGGPRPAEDDAQGEALSKGLFTKELEAALLAGEADLAVHSLKDLPIDLPEGLALAAVTPRADARDVLIYRDQKHVAAQALARSKEPEDWVPGQAVFRGFRPDLSLAGLPSGAVVATSSTRRQAQVLAARPDIQVKSIRGNVTTRLRKLAEDPGFDALILAAAGLERLGLRARSDGRLFAGPPLLPESALAGVEAPAGLLASPIDTAEMIPCVGQGVIGIEIREKDEDLTALCEAINHRATMVCVAAERAFLRRMGGGCQSPVAAHAQVIGHRLRLRAVSFRTGSARRVEASKGWSEPVPLGEAAAEQLLAEEGGA